MHIFFFSIFVYVEYEVHQNGSRPNERSHRATKLGLFIEEKNKQFQKYVKQTNCLYWKTLEIKIVKDKKLKIFISIKKKNDKTIEKMNEGENISINIKQFLFASISTFVYILKLNLEK